MDLAMNLEQQIQDLIDGAPQDGQTPLAVQLISPVLKQIAKRLKHTQYYLWQTVEQNWVVTTLNNQNDACLEQRNIYAFSRQEDALAAAAGSIDPQLMAIPVKVAELLFQTMALSSVDNLVFYDHPGNLTIGTEIGCQEIRSLIQMQLQKAKHQIPPNIA